MKVRYTFLAAAATALFLAPVASAHVEISPAKVAPDSVARLTIDVPTERNVPTVKLEMKIAPGVTQVTLPTKPGWRITNQGGVIIWSGGQIAPGKSDTFVFKAHMPNAPGKVLLFPAIQTYAKGPVVRWIGAETSDTPSPRVTLEGSGVQTIGTITLNGHRRGYRLIAGAITVAVIGGLLVLAVLFFRRRRA
jgi:uncharacterized protein YcnI